MEAEELQIQLKVTDSMTLEVRGSYIALHYKCVCEEEKEKEGEREKLNVRGGFYVGYGE